MADLPEAPLPPLFHSGDPEAVDRARGLCLTSGIILLLLGVASAWMRPAWQPSSVWLPLVFGIAASLPWFAAAAGMRGSPKPVAVGVASALCWIVITALLILPVVGIVFGLLALASGGKGTAMTLAVLGLAMVYATVKNAVPSAGYVLLLALLVVSFMLRSQLRLLTRASAPASPGRGAGALVALAYCAALAVFMQKASYSVMESSVERMQTQMAQTQASIDSTRKTLRLVQRCLTAHASAHAQEGYPRSLAALGPAGDACLESPVAAGVAGQWRLRYEPAVPDSGTRTEGYWVVAESAVRTGRGEVFYANDSGVVYEMQNLARNDSMLLNRAVIPSPLPPATGTSLAIDGSPVQALRQVRRCLLDLQTRQRYLPARLRGSRCDAYPLRPQGLEMWLDVTALFANEGPSGTYRIAYGATAAAPDTTLVAFTLTARPKTYGVDGLRSFLVDATGAVRWTLEDREATTKDPAVNPCESERDGQCRYGDSGGHQDTTR